MIQVTFQFYEDCPSHDLVLERLRVVLNEKGINANVEVVEVQSEEQAQELRFVGSPTIRSTRVHRKRACLSGPRR